MGRRGQRSPEHRVPPRHAASRPPTAPAPPHRSTSRPQFMAADWMLATMDRLRASRSLNTLSRLILPSSLRIVVCLVAVAFDPRSMGGGKAGGAVGNRAKQEERHVCRCKGAGRAAPSAQTPHSRAAAGSARLRQLRHCIERILNAVGSGIGVDDLRWSAGHWQGWLRSSRLHQKRRHRR